MFAFSHRTKADICFLLHKYLPVNNIKSKKHQVIPPEGFRVQTTLPISKRVPTGINEEEGDNFTFVGFEFLKLPL